jgi:protein-tyrosine phosphatase
VIDIHSHILPGIDDGSKSLEESIAMVRMAAAAGTTDIVASPHANQEYQFDPVVVHQKISEVQAAAGDVPRIHYGCDFHLTMENIEDALRAPEKYSIDHKGYLLVEFSDFLIPKTTQEIFGRMMSVGLRPIVTHPERNQLLQKRFTELEAWVAQGALMQVTALSFLGRFGRTAKRFADEMMSHGIVHFIASDAHDTRWRTPDMREARRYVEKQYGMPVVERIFEENPRDVLAGVELSPLPLVIRKKRWFW